MVGWIVFVVGLFFGWLNCAVGWMVEVGWLNCVDGWVMVGLFLGQCRLVDLSTLTAC